MIIELTTDIDAISSIMKEPQIWQEISGQYGDRIEEFTPILDGYIYLLIRDNIGVIGLFIIHESEYGYQCHIQIVPEHRKKHSLEAGRLVIEWTWNNTDINTLTALIPRKFPNVIKFAEMQGFKKLATINDDWFLTLEK